MPAAPSLLIVPYRSKTGRLYSQIPVPVAPATTGAGDFNVTRATTATRFNSEGLIESVPSGIPRLDYYTSGGTAGCPALLVEPSAQNFVPSGTNVGGEAGVSRTDTTTSPAVDISGTIIAKTVTGTTNLFAAQTCLTSLPSGSTTYTISRFFKYNGTDLITSLQNNNSTQWGGTAWSQNVVISAASGVTLGTSTSCTGTVENYGNGWHRVSARFTTGATPSGSTTVNYLMLVSGSVTSGSSFLTALPQLQVGSFATSYIPTTTGSVTRNADVISVSGAVSGSIGQTEGTIYVEVDVTNRANGTAAISVTKDANASGRVILYTNTNNRWRLNYTDASGTTVDDSAANDTQVLGVNKLAISYGGGSNATLHCNGTLILTLSGTSAFVQQLQSVFLGSGNAGTLFFNNRIRAAALYTTRLTDTELQALTT